MLNWLYSIIFKKRKIPPSIPANSSEVSRKKNNYQDMEQIKLAEQHFLLAEYETAAKLYQQIIEKFPAEAELYIKLAKCNLYLKNIQEAVNQFQQSLQQNDNQAEPYAYLGYIFQSMEKIDEAIRCFLKALSISPDYPDLNYHTANAYLRLQQFEKARQHLEKSVQLKQNAGFANLLLGNIEKGQGNWQQALKCYNQAIRINPEFAGTYLNIGTLYQEQKQYTQAILYYQKAVELDPKLLDAYCNWGVALVDLGRGAEAIDQFNKALEIQPDYYPAIVNLVNQKRHFCDWSSYEQSVQKLKVAVDAPFNPVNARIAPLIFLSLTGTSAAQQKRCAEKFSHLEFSAIHSPYVHKSTGQNKIIKIGYLSADFKEHPVAYQIVEIIELHDRSQFHVTAYACNNDKTSPARKRLEQAFDQFTDIDGLSFEEAAQRIHDDKIDILIDLTGYTQYTRSGILAYRPVAIQVNFLGYPGTLGTEFADYIIADSFVIPADQQDYYSETVINMPECYMPNDSKRPQPPSPLRSQCGLPEKGFVFCSFNQLAKLTPEVFDVWCRLLDNVPDSVLWVPENNEQAEKNLLKEAAARGIKSSRIIFAPKLSREEHLARQQCADLFLDTTPYNAHSTCTEALWMGLPVITCSGETFASRAAGSMLNTLGVPELITYNLQDYYAKACELATNPEKLEDIQKRIIQGRTNSPLFDSKKFTRDLERAYIEMKARQSHH
jgi:protein O-GlcNAc transferase